MKKKKLKKRLNELEERVEALELYRIQELEAEKKELEANLVLAKRNAELNSMMTTRASNYIFA